MGVFNRLSDIINANISAILDEAEDPRKMIRLITREMQETLVEVRTASARHIANRKKIRNSIDFARDQASLWEEKAELAISRGRDDLARAALREKCRHDEEARLLDGELERVHHSIDKLKQDSEQLENKLKQARTRQKALILRGETARSRLRVKRQLHEIDSSDSLARFERYEQQLDALEGEAESLDLPCRDLAKEIEALEEDQAISDELRRLRTRVAGVDAGSGPA